MSDGPELGPTSLAIGVTAPLPQFDVRVAVPDLRPWLAGNTGIPGFTTFAAPQPGPHVLLLALNHGNEIAGAIALDRMLRAGVPPAIGRLTFGFANLAAFARFNPAEPTASRFLDEDFNRLWDSGVLDGPRDSSELQRAREIRPLIDTVDVLLDLHSMLWPSDPLILCGATERGRELGLSVGTPPMVVADSGHVTGRRTIDYERFADPAGEAVAILVEAGQHWEEATVETALETIRRLLAALGMTADPPPACPTAPRFAEVTDTVTATSGSFAFVRSWRGGDVVAQRNTLLAVDGEREIRTPYDDCLLVMPSLRPSRGHTAVRLARRQPPSS
jgi:predicted deacylase